MKKKKSNLSPEALARAKALGRKGMAAAMAKARAEIGKGK